MVYSTQIIKNSIKNLLQELNYNNGELNIIFCHNYLLDLIYLLNNSSNCEQKLKETIKYGLNVNLINPKNKNTLLMDFCSKAYSLNKNKDNTEIMQALINLGADVDIQNKLNGNTALMLSLHCRNQIKCLVKNKANLTLKNHKNQNILDMAFSEHWNFINSMPNGTFYKNEYFENYCFLKSYYKKSFL